MQIEGGVLITVSYKDFLYYNYKPDKSNSIIPYELRKKALFISG